jgi:hypothetical protein
MTHKFCCIHPQLHHTAKPPLGRQATPSQKYLIGLNCAISKSVTITQHRHVGLCPFNSDDHDALMTLNERQPLLDREPPLDGLALPGKPAQVKESSVRHLGPSEITRSTRTGILAGIWVAMFLAVSLA